MTADQIFICAALITAFAVVNLPFLIFLLKGKSMSDAFKAALAALVQSFTDKLAAMQAELDAASTAQADALAAQDAEATAEVVAATPQ